MAKKSSAWDKAKYWTVGTGGTLGWLGEKALEAMGVGGGLGFFKDGGRVRGDAWYQRTKKKWRVYG